MRTPILCFPDVRTTTCGGWVNVLSPGREGLVSWYSSSVLVTSKTHDRRLIHSSSCVHYTRIPNKSFATIQTQRFASASATTHLVVNAVGADRPGIVSEVTKHVVDHGGNVGESQAAKLGHYFSLMMLCTVPTSHYESFQKSMTDLKGMNATIFAADPEVTTRAPPAIGYSAMVHLEGANQPGIVHQVTAVLAANGLSVDRLTTGEEIAPHGGTTLFRMTCLATAHEPLAKDFHAEAIRVQLEGLGERLNCDVTMEDVQDESIGASFMGG